MGTSIELRLVGPTTPVQLHEHAIDSRCRRKREPLPTRLRSLRGVPSVDSTQGMIPVSPSRRICRAGLTAASAVSLCAALALASCADGGSVVTAPGAVTTRGKNAQGFDEYTLDMDPTVVFVRVPGAVVDGVELSPFLISEYEITNAQYERFRAATGHRSRRPMPFLKRRTLCQQQTESPDLPAGEVSWEDAQAYCEWAGLSLPTLAQWNMAAYGTDGRQHPWGNEPVGGSVTRLNSTGGLDVSRHYWGGVPFEPDAVAAWEGDGYVLAAPVGSFPDGVGPFGTHDQAGNVSEWCRDALQFAHAKLRKGDGLRIDVRTIDRHQSAFWRKAVAGSSYTKSQRPRKECQSTFLRLDWMSYDTGFRPVLTVSGGR